MNSFEIIQFNKFANLHNGKTIFFCKTDYIVEAFKTIKSIQNDVILITGNSDYCIFWENESFIIKDLNQNVLIAFKKDFLPINLKYWFTANNCTSLDFIKSLPIGIENHFDCILNGHGIGWTKAVEKVKILSEEIYKPNFQMIENDFYFNNNIHTNLNYRLPLKNYLLDKKNVKVEKNSLDFFNFVQNVKKHKATICPVGNGLDTHKFYEVLMMRRIPIIFKIDNYSIYENLYDKFPCVIVDNVEKLFTKQTYDAVDYHLNNFDKKYLNMQNWTNYIKNMI